MKQACGIHKTEQLAMRFTMIATLKATAQLVTVESEPTRGPLRQLLAAQSINQSYGTAMIKQ